MLNLKLFFIFSQKKGGNAVVPSVCYQCHLLIKKLLGPVKGQIELGGKTQLNAEKKKVESVRCHVAAEGDRCWNLAGRSRFGGDTQIKRDGLI